ncbi:Coiled-coil domain-containing protein 77 [Argiope bruennichi]|uniref:Coiled-coil domain-containing protein 77 n=1 Tax=Argiope bruennichi TaxID=94029 RepID=A0A8T0FTZ1_ARGBR|nr:Coiled-coil domain-containing protein 77 [Argiope bruennichi]
MGGGKTSSSSSNENLASVAERDLLEFYRRHFDELQRKDDKYKEKVDRHLRELIADRHELEAEVLRRGEKISDLQKALVDLQLSCFEERERFLNVTAENERLKKNEEKLHESIRHLLSLTRDQELRDKIIYILQEPKVEIGVRYDSKTPGSSSSNVRKSKEDLFKEQLQKLQSQLDEHSKVSQIKSDVILEDCKLALMKSKEKLMKNEEEIAFLRKKLQDTENELSKFKQAQSRFRESYHSNEPTFSKQSANTSKYFATSDNSRNCASPENHYPNETTSSKQSANAANILTIQSSQVYVEAAKLPKSKASSQVYIGESEVIQLQNYVRQCTRLSFDVSNLLKSLTKAVTSEEVRVRGLDVERELKELASAVEELAVATAEADLVCISLSRATFFDCLTGPKKTFEKFGVKEKSNLSKYISEVGKMEANLKSANSYVSQSLKFAERINQKCSTLSSETRDQIIQVDSDLHKNLHSSRDNLHSSENKLEALAKQSRSAVMAAEAQLTAHRDNARVLSQKLRETEELLRESINECLVLKQKLQVEQLNREMDKAKFSRELHEKLHQISDFHDLETAVKEVASSLASKRESKSSGPYVCMHCREGLEHMLCSEKIKDLKSSNRRLASELKQEMDKAKFNRELHERLQHIPDYYDRETSVKRVDSSVDTKKESKACGPYECMYCNQGLEHLPCTAKIKDLRSTTRRLATELKLLEHENKEEKRLARMSQEQATKALRELSLENKSLKDTVKTLEAVLIFEHDKKDLELLKTVHSTAQHSKQATAAIRRLKAKLYELENDIKNL